VEEGYTVAAEATDSPVQGALTTLILYRGGEDEAQNKANAKQIAKKVFPGSEWAELNQDYDDEVSPDATVIVVVGEDWAPQLVPS
jgi:LytR cell envelope-related transcriptional attenuator